MKGYFDTEDIDPASLSSWVLRLVLNQQMIVAKKVSPQIIAERIKEFIPLKLNTIASTENDYNPVIQIRLLKEEETNGDSHVSGNEMLKSMLNVLLSQFVLFGTKGIDTVYISEDNINEIEDTDERSVSHLFIGIDSDIVVAVGGIDRLRTEKFKQRVLVHRHGLRLIGRGVDDTFFIYIYSCRRFQGRLLGTFGKIDLKGRREHKS